MNVLQWTIFRVTIERQYGMSSSNWEKFGEDIRKTVQDAVENKNYDKLNQIITDMLNQTADAVATGVKNAANTSQTKYRGYKTYTTDYESQEKARSEQRKASGMKYTNAKNEVRTVPVNSLVKAPSKMGTLIGTALGFVLGGSQLIILIILFVVTVFANAAFGLGSSILTGIIGVIVAALSGTGFYAGIQGAKKYYRIERFKSYLSAIGNKEYCNISELTEKVGKSAKTVVKDLEYMIRKNWFKQGHLDKQKTCLMVTDKMYTQYCQLEQQKAIAQKDAQEREAKAQKIREEQIASGKVLSPEVQKVIDLGDEYVRKIRKCNDDIPGEEISEKIYRIEILVDKIFDRVEQNPKCVADIKKLMDYYLPTTVKLLEAYVEMDAQPAGGENIQTAKKEIEATLDTLNIAFEKLLDSLFQETAWDVSSDISVLNTMLAQEGLKEDGLKRK